VLNVLLLSWLYAYYCYDYKWALQGARLPQRLAFFEAQWAFFAGGWQISTFIGVNSTVIDDCLRSMLAASASDACTALHAGAALSNPLLPSY
jgi:hypothetical protein